MPTITSIDIAKGTQNNNLKIERAGETLHKVKRYAKEEHYTTFNVVELPSLDPYFQPTGASNATTNSPDHVSAITPAHTSLWSKNGHPYVLVHLVHTGTPQLTVGSMIDHFYAPLVYLPTPSSLHAGLE